MNIFKNSKIYEYNNNLYSYAELKELKLKFPQFCKEGNVVNIESGRTEDIQNFEKLFNDAIQHTNNLMIDMSVPSKIKSSIGNTLINYNIKDEIDAFTKKIKDGSITFEEINYYWELKQPINETIVHNYKMKNFIKVSSYEYKSELFKNFSMIDKGRILELIDLMSMESQIIKDRKYIMEKLEFEDSEMFRRFMKKLNDEEIIYRLQKSNKKDVVFALNPFLFTKTSQRELNIELFEMFPKSFKIFLPLDVYYYFKLKHEKEFTKINIDNYYDD